MHQCTSIRHIHPIFLIGSKLSSECSSGLSIFMCICLGWSTLCKTGLLAPRYLLFISFLTPSSSTDCSSSMESTTLSPIVCFSVVTCMNCCYHLGQPVCEDVYAHHNLVDPISSKQSSFSKGFNGYHNQNFVANTKLQLLLTCRICLLLKLLPR